MVAREPLRLVVRKGHQVQGVQGVRRQLRLEPGHQVWARRGNIGRLAGVGGGIEQARLGFAERTNTNEGQRRRCSSTGDSAGVDARAVHADANQTPSKQVRREHPGQRGATGGNERATAEGALDNGTSLKQVRTPYSQRCLGE